MASPAGLSWRCPSATAHFITAAIRFRTFFAVARLVFQIGIRMARTSAVETVSTGIRPMRGMA